MGGVAGWLGSGNGPEASIHRRTDQVKCHTRYVSGCRNKSNTGNTGKHGQVVARITILWREDVYKNDLVTLLETGILFTVGVQLTGDSPEHSAEGWQLESRMCRFHGAAESLVPCSTRFGKASRRCRCVLCKRPASSWIVESKKTLSDHAELGGSRRLADKNQWV